MIPLPSSVKQTVRRRAERTLVRICYPHVPKCAGMSVARGISRQAFSALERRLFPTPECRLVTGFRHGASPCPVLAAYSPMAAPTPEGFPPRPARPLSS